jgi:serine/threonine-protein kinase
VAGDQSSGKKPLWDATTAAGDRGPPGEEALYGAEFGPGALIGDWVVEELRARGGFGVVYRAHHAATGEVAAVKVLHAHLVGAPGIRRRFRQEAETVQRLRHPNVVTVHAYGELSDGRPWFAMEWVEGHTLADELAARGPVTLGEVVPIVEELGAALDAAHALGVIHRDLKASNVLLVPEGERMGVKLVDFGVAKLTEQDPGTPALTSTGARVGTPHSMAPEQILGQTVDARTDVYALGVLVFQLLTGHFPFTGESALEIEELHLSAPPPRPSDHAPVPLAVDAVVLRCLAKKRDERYASAAEAVAALRRAASGAVEGEPQRPSGRFRALPGAGVGVYLEAGLAVDEADADDALLDALDELLVAARDELAAAGLTPAVDAASAVLAVAPLPPEPLAAREARRRAVEAALNLSYHLAEGRDPRLSVSLVLHSASLTTIMVEPPQFVAGDLLLIADWTPARIAGAVVATDAALEGLEDLFELDDAPGAARRVIAAR